MKIPEGFTERGDSNEQPPETYDKRVSVIFDSKIWPEPMERSANLVPWKIPDGQMRVIAYKVLP